MSEETTPITAILTTYRRPGYLRRAVTSVLKQSYRRLKVLVLDDASNDETEAVVRGLMAVDPRIEYVRHETNIGMTPNWRYGLEHVETPYFSFLSDDDLQLPRFYETALAYLEANPDVDFFVGTTIMFDTEGFISGVSTDGWAENVYRPFDGMLRMMQQPPNWDGVVFRKSVYDRIGTLRNIHATDYEFLVRAARRCSFVVSPEPCAMFQYHGGRLAWKPAITRRRWELFHESIRLSVDLLDAKGLPADVLSAAWPIMNSLVYSAGKYLFLGCMVDRQPQEALEAARYLARLCPGSLSAYKFMALARIAERLPWVSAFVRSRLENPRPVRGSRQRLWRAKYGMWCDYAVQLAQEKIGGDTVHVPAHEE